MCLGLFVSVAGTFGLPKENVNGCIRKRFSSKNTFVEEKMQVKVSSKRQRDWCIHRFCLRSAGIKHFPPKKSLVSLANGLLYWSLRRSAKSADKVRSVWKREREINLWKTAEKFSISFAYSDQMVLLTFCTRKNFLHHFRRTIRANNLRNNNLAGRWLGAARSPTNTINRAAPDFG